jgi:hypothetical protein
MENIRFPLKKARILIGFSLDNMPFKLILLEKKGESAQHRMLKETSRIWFIDNGYLVGRAKTRPHDCRVWADYFVIENEDDFQFVECLTSPTSKEVLRKSELAKWAPLWIVIPDSYEVEPLLVIKNKDIRILSINKYGKAKI